MNADCVQISVQGAITGVHATLKGITDVNCLTSTERGAETCAFWTIHEGSLRTLLGYSVLLQTGGTSRTPLA